MKFRIQHLLLLLASLATAYIAFSYSGLNRSADSTLSHLYRSTAGPMKSMAARIGHSTDSLLLALPSEYKNYQISSNLQVKLIRPVLASSHEVFDPSSLKIEEDNGEVFVSGSSNVAGEPTTAVRASLINTGPRGFKTH